MLHALTLFILQIQVQSEIKLASTITGIMIPEGKIEALTLKLASAFLISSLNLELKLLAVALHPVNSASLPAWCLWHFTTPLYTDAQDIHVTNLTTFAAGGF